MSSSSLYTQIFHGKPGEPGELRRMENTVAEYPYFSLAHYYLLKESGAESHIYSAAAAMAAMHVQNPFLLRLRNTKQTWHVPAPVSAAIQAETEPSASMSHGEQLINRMTEEIVQKTAAPQQAEPLAATVEIPASSAETEPLLFEPLHTSDYFASQGIKLSEEMQSADKLGRQLKSFTEWLKTMKKVQAQKPQAENNLPIDATVERMAEKSNKEEDVITETMAEVLAGQGKKKKAMEIYEKLLLQNPSKSAYFAAKIDSLKES